jgi:hypothetical protein
MPKFTVEELLDTIRREIRMRRRVYPGLVHTKRMTQDEMDLEIAKMKAIEEIIKRQRQPDLEI